MKNVSFNSTVCIYTYNETQPIIKKKFWDMIKKKHLWDLIKNIFFFNNSMLNDKFYFSYLNDSDINESYVNEYDDSHKNNSNYESNYEFINYNINLDSSLKETYSLFEYFRKSWNISLIVILTALCYIYFSFKKTNKESKF